MEARLGNTKNIAARLGIPPRILLQFLRDDPNFPRPVKNTPHHKWWDFKAIEQYLDNKSKIQPESVVMLISERTGKPYTKDHFGDIFREIRLAAGINKELQFRDLRKTSIVMYALAGCSDTEITSISGHKNSEVSDILEVYLPRNSLMAKHASAKLKAYMGASS